MMGTGWLIVFGVVLGVTVTAWLVARGPVRHLVEGLRFDRARAEFRQQREWLEARFLGALARVDPPEAARWDDARWQDEVRWARDRRSRRLLALIGVEFDPSPFDENAPRHATALFEYRKGRWFADGQHVDMLRPDEALLRHRRYEPVTPPQPKA
jgi:hypothetical protein